ncbi:GINS complex subunit [Exophiala oligosperma]
MDLDISDILADVSRPSGGISGSTNSISHSATDTDTFVDHQLLVRAWTSERCAPDLLPYPEDLMGRVMSRVQNQIIRIEDMASGMGDGGFSSAANFGDQKGSTQNSNLILSILQTDLGRTQFLVRSLLRIRLSKLTKHAMHYLRLTEDRKSLYLSSAETQFVRNHQALLAEFYDSSFLSAFPTSLKRLDDVSGGANMVEGPDLGSAVVVRCLVEFWRNDDDIENRDDSNATTTTTTAASVELSMRRGEIWIVRWRDVKAGVERGEIELL